MPVFSSAPNSPASVFQRSLIRKLAEGSVCAPYFWLVSLAVADTFRPSKSNGRKVRISTVPAMPPVTIVASVDLYTSRPLTAVAGRSWNENWRPPELNNSRPLSVVTALGRPRITTEVVSPWKPWATCTPVTRCRASATLLSGSLPMSSATMESTTIFAFCLIDCAPCRLSRNGVTVTPVRFTALVLASASRCAWVFTAGLAAAGAAGLDGEAGGGFARGGWAGGGGGGGKAG